MPRPPAWVPAAACLPPGAEPVGSSRIGCWIPSSRVNAVSIVAMMNHVQPIKLFLNAAHPHDGALPCIPVVLDAMAMRHIPRVGARFGRPRSLHKWITAPGRRAADQHEAWEASDADVTRLPPHCSHQTPPPPVVACDSPARHPGRSEGSMLIGVESL